MNFTVSQSSLQTALDIVMKGIGSNPSLPILSGVYLKVQEGTLEIQSNDLTVSIKHKVAANVEEEGENKPVKLWGSYLEFQNGDCRGINSEFLKDFEILE